VRFDGCDGRSTQGWNRSWSSEDQSHRRRSTTLLELLSGLTLLSSGAARGQLDLRHAQDSYDRGNSRRKLRWIGDGRLWWPLDQYGRGRVGRLD
jgi:hypothetical protein